ncbi:ATP-binding cassette domain-containing protein [Pseudarthrobacter sp. J75]|uniref:methionine ABC transporter ATP-binding protein n=1 Tax=unclassified Pseudarthrobacter TaxID=2647000 RepID=UPI002E800350|nr:MULTISPECIES: ATP-binding cassette domain-containing protein [unclassified Pseudarthrobacter]MEE2521332.1 ATP-binding cassette domain-containing protein [Pseudarthrobacter sp. J47]MEE2528564.1 ATP-binding cassette domain-containing protein [Pseudarthrobacter sp. J75]MEE2568255.1 ATP-binding cassette domain-containing protein [Pseudarthrobacter sp. J64]
MITVTDLRKVYRQGKKEVVALDGVTLSVPKGSIHGIIGHSGAGKSTLVRCLTLLDRPTSGSVSIDGTELSSVKDSQIRAARRRIGMVFQHANLMDSRTAAGNVAHPLELVGTPKDKIRAKVTELLSLVGLEGFEGAYPSQLSGGQRQRVGIARALAADPDVLLCDEPTSALDPATTDEILDLIQDLTRRLKLTVLIITHEMNVVKRVCDSVSLLSKGRIIEHGALEDVAGDLESRLAKALLPLPPAEPLKGALQGGPVLEILFAGDSAKEPVLTGVARHFDIDLNVLAGSVETLGGQQFGHLRVQLADDADAAAVLAYLHERGIGAKVADPAAAVDDADINDITARNP